MGLGCDVIVVFDCGWVAPVLPPTLPLRPLDELLLAADTAHLRLPERTFDDLAD